MAATVIQAVGGVSPDAIHTTFAQTIAATGGGRALIAFGIGFTAGTRSFSSNGSGTWSQVYDNGSFSCCWLCLNPSAGTTSVTMTNSVNASMLFIVMEVSGLASGGANYAAAEAAPSTAAWTSNSINPGVSYFGVGVAYQGTDNVNTSSAGTGYTAVSGSGLSSGNVIDGTNFDVVFIETGNFTSGSNTSSGTWTAALNSRTYLFGFDVAAADTLLGAMCL